MVRIDKDQANFFEEGLSSDIRRRMVMFGIETYK